MQAGSDWFGFVADAFRNVSPVFSYLSNRDYPVIAFVIDASIGHLIHFVSHGYGWFKHPLWMV